MSFDQEKCRTYETSDYHGETSSDYLGNQIETGNPMPVEVYHPDEKLPDYTLYPLTGLKILGIPRNVTVTARLGSLSCCSPTWESSLGSLQVGYQATLR
jgi:hypothetical protein